mmetsp:Transcript_38075/g.89146  ORF Transcript_38075/g.89146 Transcript_38075/m.89146 type:complete len:220 (+) Transcript_38075:1092-1751(+)
MKLSVSFWSLPKPPEAMITAGDSIACAAPSVSTSTFHWPSAIASRPCHFDFSISLKRSGFSAANFFSNSPMAKVSSAPTKPLDGLNVRFAEWPPSCDRIDKSTFNRSCSHVTAPAESEASFSIKSLRARWAALFVVSASKESTDVSSAALMPEDALPELPPKYGCLSMRTTAAFRSRSDNAATIPARPPPMTTASGGPGAPNSPPLLGATAWLAPTEAS